MTGTSQPTNQPVGTVITDEASLEKLFRAQYASLVTEAKAKLGKEGEAAAPRVVSKAFHQAWNDRAQFSSPEELSAFLKAAIQHGAARELSRLAGLHRVDHAVGTNHPEGAQAAGHDAADLSVDEAWMRLQHTLQGSVPEAQRRRASISRHEAAEHVAALGKRRNWRPLIFTGVGALLALIALIWYVDKQGEARRVLRALAEGDARKYETPVNQQVNVTLDDETIVRLAPQTRITVPKLFGANLRAVKVDGAGQFNVTRAMEKPLQVHVGDVIVFARGTIFTVRSYPEDSAATVVVKEGSVDVRRGDEVRTLAQGTALRARIGGPMEVPSTAVAEEASGWADGTVIISERTLRYVLPQLKRLYGLDIRVVDSRLLDRQVFVRAAIGSPREAISSVEQSAGVKFVYVGQSMTFQDTAAARVTGTRRR